MPISVWTDQTESSMNEIIKNIENYEQWYQPEIDMYDNSKLNYTIIKRFDKNMTLSLEASNIEYNVFDYQYEKIRSSEKNNAIRATRVQASSGFVIVFTDGKITRFVSNRAFTTNTKAFLRKINNYTEKMELAEEKFSIISDLFFWLISKVISGSNQYVGESQSISLGLITGFKGGTDDKLADIEGSGDRIINLISTLTFLVEIEELSRIELMLSHDNNTYRIKLGTDGFIEVDTKKYVGEYLLLDDNEMVPKVILKVLLLVIPELLSAYNEEIEESIWNDDTKSSFLEKIGDTIQKRIQQKLGFSKLSDAI